MEHVTNTAVWGSMLSALLLGAFIWVQALTDPPRRWRLAAFATICWVIAMADYLRPLMGAWTYEKLRLFLWPLYGSSVTWLMTANLWWVAAAGLFPCLAGILVWMSGAHAFATSVALPLSLGTAALAHGYHYWSHRGYASGLLCAYSGAMALSCSMYARAVATNDSRVVALGYIHWVLLNVLAVGVGWVQLPRELRGIAPVRLKPVHAILFLTVVLLSEALNMLGLLQWFTWPPTWFIIGNLILLTATAILYFYNRHHLVLFTDNVTALLEERTASLRLAQDELAHQNELQALRLTQQETELAARAAVIERQRRLELAAQTAGQVAHDIQNLISPMQTQLEILGASGDGQLVQDAATRIGKQVNGLLNLNGQLLALSRRGRMDTQPLQLSELVTEVLQRFPDPRLSSELPVDAWVSGSWPQLVRALTNLVANALEAAPRESDRITVRTGLLETQQVQRCHLGFLTAGRYAQLAVTDSGPGIPPDIQDRIFDPFFSSKRGTHRSGSGLGLSIVTAVVDDHRGVLDLETGPGGTRFSIFLPAVSPPQLESVAANEPMDATILLVDDDQQIRDSYGGMLEAAGFDVILAADGREALEILQRQSFDLVVMDIKMPHLSGPDLFFGALHIRPGIRAVVHSGHLDPAEELRLRQLGISAILQKPAGRREFLATIRGLLQERRAAEKASWS